MKYSKSTQEVFNSWAQDYHADGMEEHHWPRVRQALEFIPEMTGNYLEIGVGNGYGIHYIATHQFAHGQCYGLDLSPNMIERARQKIEGLRNVHLESADFLTWQPKSGLRFSLIFSMEVFYYFHDIQAGIDKALSLLKPGGMLMVLVNYYKEHQASHSWPEELDTPMQLWSASDYLSGFEKAGLQNVQQRRFTDPPEAAKPGDPGTLATWGIHFV